MKKKATETHFIPLTLIKLNSPETHAQLKERETFWQHRLKTIYPIGRHEKEECLY